MFYVRSVQLYFITTQLPDIYQFLSTTSAGKFRSKKLPATPSALARFLEEHPFSSEFKPVDRSRSDKPPAFCSISKTFLPSIFQKLYRCSISDTMSQKQTTKNSKNSTSNRPNINIYLMDRPSNMFFIN